MGLFSWITSDTKRSIPCTGSGRKVFTVHMITEDGRVFTENSYEGYGVFGGKDIYDLIAELNGKTEKDSLGEIRGNGIDLVFSGLDGKLNNDNGDFNVAAEAGVKVPKLVENKNCTFNSVPYPNSCPDQGYFYSDDEDLEEQEYS